MTYSKDELLILGEKLLTCVSKENVWHISEFCEEQKKCPSWIYEIARDYPIIKDYLERAKKILGRKFINQAMTAKPDSWMTKLWFKRLMHSDWEPIKDWAKEDIEEEAYAKANAAKQANIHEVDERLEKLIEALENKNISS